jgi:hypothetical protein
VHVLDRGLLTHRDPRAASVSLGSSRRPVAALGILDLLDRVLLRALVLCSVALLSAWVVWAGRTTDRVWATGLAAFAWAEFVNYFHVRLMHDTRSDLKRLAATRKFRRSWLATDLAVWRHTNGNAG